MNDNGDDGAKYMTTGEKLKKYCTSHKALKDITVRLMDRHLRLGERQKSEQTWD